MGSLGYLPLACKPHPGVWTGTSDTSSVCSGLVSCTSHSLDLKLLLFVSLKALATALSTPSCPFLECPFLSTSSSQIPIQELSRREFYGLFHPQKAFSVRWRESGAASTLVPSSPGVFGMPQSVQGGSGYVCAHFGVRLDLVLNLSLACFVLRQVIYPS
jgi:hypothetical protein